MSLSWRASRRWFLFLALVVSIGVAGCGGGSGAVSGDVSFDGKPLPGGNVTFVSTEGKPSASASIRDGRYTVPQIRAGNYKVSVETSSLKPSSGGPRMAPPQYKPPSGSGSTGYTPNAEDTTKRYMAISPEYEDANTSGLTFKATGGSQTFNIPLTKK